MIEQEVLRSDRWGLETGALRLRHLERLPVETTYPKSVDRISTLLNTSEIKDGEKCEGAEVVLDITGSGRAILELFARADIHPVRVRKRLKMAKDLDLVETLMNELREFKMRPPRIDPSDPETWRDTEFDDLVFAVALVAWRANRYISSPKIKRDKRPRRRGSQWSL